MIIEFPSVEQAQAWIERAVRRVSTHDLLGVGRFVLFVGTGSGEWEIAAATVGARLRIDIGIVSIGTPDGWRDVSGAWASVRSVSAEGAVLVRPDGHIGWRTAHAPTDKVRALDEALAKIIGRNAGTLGSSVRG